MRLHLPALPGLPALALLGACATHHSPVPTEGLIYSCHTPGSTDVSEAMIVFNGQGYQPGNVVLAAGGAAPRSTARLTFAGREHELMADSTYLGMRYRSTEQSESGRTLVWVSDGEDARILSVPISGQGGEVEIANCTRKRSVDGATDGEHGDTHPR